ncbi:MAG: Wzz/FepE/Etk N-terminal domain-containing protein, partial [Caldilinea sp.]|nr:Wzz/FepE/Etk N-terminal domain-containing protein [Caldilinea sp.]
MDDEIDLRQYLDVLIAWRWEILAIMVLATLVAAGVVLIQRAVTPPVYSATATLAIARTGRDIQFDENFRTTLDAENPANTRRIALVGLVTSNAVAEVVAKGLSDAFDEKERAPIQLIKQIEAAAVTAPGSRTEGDLIQITARAGEPEKAAELATTWAKVYVEYANRLYGDVPVQLIESVQNELAQAQVAYDSTQAKLESFLSANGVSSLERRITEKTNLIDSLQQNQLQVMQAYIEQQIAAVKQVADALLKQEIEAKTAAFEQEVAATKKVFSAALEQELRSAETVYNTALEQELTAKTAVFEQELNAVKTVFDAALQQEVTAAETVYNTALRQELESTQTVLQTALDLELDSTRTLVNTALQQELAAAQKVLNTSLDQELAARSELQWTEESITARRELIAAQFGDQLARLQQSYTTRQRVVRLLDDARSLLAQVTEPTQTAAASNALAILLLKSQAYNTAGVPTAAPLQLRLDDLAALSGSTAAQQAELQTLVEILQGRLTELDTSIAAQTQDLIGQDGFALIASDPESDAALLTALQEQGRMLFDMGLLKETGQPDLLQLAQDNNMMETLVALPIQELLQRASESSLLNSASKELLQELLKRAREGTLVASIDESPWPELLRRAQEGRLMAEMAGVPWQTLLAQTGGITLTTSMAESPWKELLQRASEGRLMDGMAAVPWQNLLDQASENSLTTSVIDVQLQQLLALVDDKSLLASMVAAPLTASVEGLEAEITALEAQLETVSSQRKQLESDRDLALKSLDALKNKALELQLANTALPSEVRFASPALPSLLPEQSISLGLVVVLAAMVGLMGAVFGVFLANYLGKTPIGRRWAASGS